MPASFNKFAYCLDNPMNSVDITGEDTFKVNRTIGGNRAQLRIAWIDRISPTHTFVVVTDKNGNIEHTYSWGNDPDAKNKNVKGKWYKDESEDWAAAKEALKNDLAEKVGDTTLDPYIEKAFGQHFNKENDPSNHRNLWLTENCKTETGELVDEAKKLQQKDKEQTDKAPKDNQSKNQDNGATVSLMYIFSLLKGMF